MSTFTLNVNIHPEYQHSLVDGHPMLSTLTCAAHNVVKRPACGPPPNVRLVYRSAPGSSVIKKKKKKKNVSIHP